MEAFPNHDPDVSRDEADALREHVAAVIDMLPDLHRYIIELLYIEGLSMREAEIRTARSKTTIARIRDDALATMRDLLEDNKEIQRRLSE